MCTYDERLINCEANFTIFFVLNHVANDGLLPEMFGELDSTGNPRKGALFAGKLVLSSFIPLAHLS